MEPDKAASILLIGVYYKLLSPIQMMMIHAAANYDEAMNAIIITQFECCIQFHPTAKPLSTGTV